MITRYWSVSVDCDVPEIEGPYSSAEQQKRTIRDQRARGSQAYWLDVRPDGEPVIGNVTVDDGSPYPAPVAGQIDVAELVAAHDLIRDELERLRAVEQDMRRAIGAALESLEAARGVPGVGRAREHLRRFA